MNKGYVAVLDVLHCGVDVSEVFETRDEAKEALIEMINEHLETYGWDEDEMDEDEAFQEIDEQGYVYATDDEEFLENYASELNDEDYARYIN